MRAIPDASASDIVTSPQKFFQSLISQSHGFILSTIPLKKISVDGIMNAYQRWAHANQLQKPRGVMTPRLLFVR